MSSTRPEHLGLGGFSHPAVQPRSGSPSTSNSPSDPSSRSPFGLPGAVNPAGVMAANTRSGTGSPSHEMTGPGRLFSKSRAREIQAQEGIPGLPLNPWGGPPTSGNSTPLRENIPESPTDGFPDFVQLPTPESMPQTRRARAGTVPSRFPPGLPAGGGLLNIPGSTAKSARATPTQSPFAKTPSPGLDPTDNASNSSTLLSRLRAGSMPQRSPFAPMPGTASPFGPSIFSSWNPTGVGRERGSTLASIASVGSNGPSSPAQSQFSKEGTGESDVHMRTLDYLGLAETPQPPRAQLATPYMPSLDFAKQASRFRSYSVNNKDKYADEEDYDTDEAHLESQYAAALQDQLAATNAAIHSHNLAVQAFVNQASATRPRARTAGVLDTPGSRLMRTYLSGGQNAPGSLTPTEIRLQDDKEYDDLPQAVAGLNLGRSNSRNAGLLSSDEQGLEGPTSALWLGSVPTSTTTSTLIEMFKSHGPVLSARVLTHKNCGFVNFERVESAISAKASMNGKEIFPGAGPIRINFAKPASASNTPGHDGVFPSPSPDPFNKSQDSGPGAPATATGEGSSALDATNLTPTVPPLREMTRDVLNIVSQFGASEEDTLRISQNVQSAIQFTRFIDEIPPVREPTHTRVHDAPKLRDIRKRIDNQSLSQAEIENIAVDMLPEIAELSSDYLGNTVVQKLFEHCSDPLRDAMLAEIAPHLAEIGIHKNGTWAAQKIIDVCKTPAQLSVIVEHLRPYTLPLFLDQYGNYVLQGCLKFGAPYNDFIFETMLSRMWDTAQGRYGARAMRACLESHHASKDQQRLLAAAIALHSVQLATNANGALLLTWFLDTCTFPLRRTVLSPRLVPYLVHLCTHKVAYLTVLKVINQKAEADARDTILKALFFTPNDQVLEAILSDQACGATLIFKVLTTPFFDESIRGQVVENVKNVLVRIKAQPSQGYKRLMDEVGLSTRNSGAPRDASTHSEHRQRPASRQANSNGHPQSAHSNKPFYNAPNSNSSQGNFEMSYGSQRGDTADSAVPQFPAYGQGMMYNTSNMPVPPAMGLQQLQFQQNMMGRGGGQMGYNFLPMQAGFGGYNGSNPSIDQFRQQSMANGSPVQTTPAHMPQMPSGQPGFAPPGFGMNMNPYNYGNMPPGMQNMGYMQQQEQVNSRRGRVSSSKH
ncbi:RNA binding [Paramyrothecium foliicola]|nr:RNA binding [Paramyrothecium foliicola]